MKTAYIKSNFTTLVGTNISTSYLLKKADARIAKNGNRFVNLVLADTEGELVGIDWKPDGSYESAAGKVITAFFKVNNFNDQPQLEVTKLVGFKQLDDDNQANFVRCSSFKRDDVYNEFLKLMAKLREESLKLLIAKFINSSTFELFCNAPAAIKMHHAFRGGLAEHTIQVITMAEDLVRSANSIGGHANLDVVLISAAFHDIGKIKSISEPSIGVFEGSQTGDLIDHISWGYRFVSNMCKNSDVEPELTEHIGHCILAHHGKLEWGSPVVPKTVEALLLHSADFLSAKVTGLEETENGQYSHMFGTRIWRLANET